MNRIEFVSPGVRFKKMGHVFVDAGWSKEGVTDQFLDNADTYHGRYFNNDYWSYLIERGLKLGNVDKENTGFVLDIGSGSGNTVFPLLSMLPKASVIASDISPQLLNILALNLQRSDNKHRNVDLYCFDLHKDVFAGGVFDLVVGGAVLHHMLDPKAALNNVAKWVRPGGAIILYEPFEYGAHLFAVLFQLATDAIGANSNENDQRLKQFFKAMKKDIEARLGAPEVKPWTANLDDKWYFNTSYLRDLGTSLGLKDVEVHTLTDNFSEYFRDNIRGLLNVSGNSDLNLPDEVNQIVTLFDSQISTILKAKFLLEGIVVFRR